MAVHNTIYDHEYSIGITVSADRTEYTETHKCDCGDIAHQHTGKVADSPFVQAGLQLKGGRV